MSVKECIMALETRVSQLEKTILGSNYQHHKSEPPQPELTSSLLSQLAEIRVQLSNTYAQSPAFHEATTQLDDALELVVQHSTDPTQIAAIAQDSFTLNLWLNRIDSISARTATTDKLVVIQSAESDLKSAVTDLTRLDTLDASLDTSRLSDVLNASGGIASLQQKSQTLDSHVMKDIGSSVYELVDLYGAYVDQLSEIFVNLDEEVHRCEQKLNRLQRKEESF